MNTLYQSDRGQTDSTFEPRHNGIYDLLIILSCGCFAMAYAFGGIYMMNLLVMVIYFICTYALYKEKKYGCFFFYLTFFLFLLGTIFFGLFDSTVKYKFQSSEIEAHVLLSLTLAIVGVYIGSVLKERKIIFGNLGRTIQNSDREMQQAVSGKMRSFLRYACIVALVADIINAMAKAVFVMANSYVSYYLDYQAPLPYFVLWLSGAAPLLFYFYIGTLPRKRDTAFPAVLYVLVGVVALFYGQRNVFTVRAIILLCYFLLRNKYAPNDEIWITKHQIRIVIIALPFAIAFMSFWRSYRSGLQYENKNLLESILEGILNQGNDIAILDYEYRYRSILPNKPFAVGGIISMLRNNIIARILRIPSVPAKANTIETALYGYSFSSALMYQQNRNGYLLGYGIGSSYIAELCNTFGYVGILIGSIIYGVILKKLGRFKIRGFIATGFALSMFQQLLMAPRSTFDSFITGTFPVAHLFIAIVCWFLSNRVWPKREEYE